MENIKNSKHIDSLRDLCNYDKHLSLYSYNFYNPPSSPKRSMSSYKVIQNYRKFSSCIRTYKNKYHRRRVSIYCNKIKNRLSAYSGKYGFINMIDDIIYGYYETEDIK